MVSIIIPVYNEKQGLIDVIGEIHEALSGKIIYEIIVIDDCSNEDVATRISQLENSQVKFLRNVTNMGYGFSLKKGIAFANFDVIVIIDADGTYPTTNLLELISIYEKGFDLVVASRGKSFSEDSLLKSMFRKFLRFIVEYCSGTIIPDVNSGLRIFSKRTITPYFHLLSNRFSFTTSMTLLYALDHKMIRFEENGYRKRIGKSKVHLRKDILRTLQIIVEIIALKNPLKLHLLLIMVNILLFGFIFVFQFFIQNKISSISIYSFLIILFIQFSLTANAIQKK
jgi:polyisoprenyl-phosphate glycosyltransferase